jgi:hydrogenase maturation protease
MMKIKSTTKIAVIGLGNPVLSDDTIGLLIVKQLENAQSNNFPGIKFAYNYSGGFDLMEALMGYHKSIIVDSICTGQVEPGFCHEFNIHALGKIKQSGLLSSHGLNLPTLLEVGKRCGYPLPSEIALFGIEGVDFENFSEQPTKVVKAGLKSAIARIHSKLINWTNN